MALGVDAVARNINKPGPVINDATPVGLLVVGGIGCIALSQTRAAPVIAGVLTLAVIYQGLALYGQVK